VSWNALQFLASADHHTTPLWGAPRIHGELLKLGINVSQSAAA
jgi:hypothetical protein